MTKDHLDLLMCLAYFGGLAVSGTVIVFLMGKVK